MFASMLVDLQKYASVLLVSEGLSNFSYFNMTSFTKENDLFWLLIVNKRYLDMNLFWSMSPLKRKKGKETGIANENTNDRT